MALAEEGTARFRRLRSEQAINLAMQSRWDEAVAANQSILNVFPNDVDSYNRLGKAYTELGRYDEARDSYAKALSMEPSNTIARKNLTRLSGLKGSEPAGAAVATKVDPKLFIEEAGKTAVSALNHVGSRDVVAKVTAGDQVSLEHRDDNIHVFTLGGDYLGRLEPRLGTRLTKLMASGNRYEAAITSVTDQQVRVIVRETYQSAANAGRVSFPSRAETGFRPYIKESVLQYGLDEDDEMEYYEDEAEERTGGGGDWEEDGEQEGNGFMSESLPMDQDEDEEEE
jgi:hypothetical protein